jgi:hypothetical protein
MNKKYSMVAFPLYSPVSLYDMLRVYAKPFLEALPRISYMSGLLVGFKVPTHIFLEENKKPEFRTCIQIVRNCCETLNLNNSIMLIDRIKKDFDLPTYKISSALADLQSLEETVVNEISTSIFYNISFHKAAFFENVRLFGENVFDKFPSANFDIEEAGKCFATARYTACVMHLQRVLEVGLKGYSKYFGINLTAQPAWQNILDQTAKQIKDRNDRNNVNVNWNAEEEKQFCEGVQPFLVAVKTAWRNPSMHADKTYTEEVAQEIFNSIKSFMRNLALHLNEKGTFTP